MDSKIEPVAPKPFPVGGDDRGDWIPVSRQTLDRLGDHKVLRAGLGKLSPDACARLGMSKDEANAVEALFVNEMETTNGL